MGTPNPVVIVEKSKAHRLFMFMSAALFFLGALAHVTIDTDSLRLDFWNPQFRCEEAVFDFGRVKANGTVKHTFHVKNAGGGRLTVLGLSPACSCMSIISSNLELKSEETGLVTAVLALPALHGPQLKAVEVLTNDPLHRRMQLVFRGDVLTCYEVSSYSLALDSGRLATRSAVVSVNAKTSSRPFAIIDIQASPPLVDVSADGGKAQKHTLRIGLKEGVRGSQHCAVHLITDNKEEPDIVIELVIDGGVDRSLTRR